MQNVPKPTKVTRSPFFKVEETLLMNVSITAVACVLLIAVAEAIRSTKSALFMHYPPDAVACGCNYAPAALLCQENQV
jgi:hypothetical protein